MASLSKTVTEKRNNLTCEIYGGQNQIVKQVWCRCGFCQDQMCPDCNINKRKKCLKILLCQQGKWMPRKPCKNDIFTSQKTLEEALKNHERECVYRSVPCIFSAIVDEFECETEVTFQNVIQHYEETYAISKLDNQVLMAKNDLMLDDEPSTFDTFSHPITFSLNNQTFLLVQKTSKQITYFWVYLLGSSEQAEDLSYILRCFAKDSDNVFRGKVAAIDETFETIDEAGKCFTISHKTFMNQFVDENRKC